MVNSEINVQNDIPLVSVVIPVYNTGRFLEKCIETVCSQTYTNIEIICVNDGSTDNSKEILDEFEKKDKRIIVITKENEKTGGAAPARNAGLKRATGKYIQFLDSDDFFDLNMIEEMVNKAEKTSSDVVICTSYIYDDRESKVLRLNDTIELKYAPDMDYFSYKNCPDYIFHIGELITWNKMYRLDFIREHNLYFEAIPISDDQYLPALALVFAKRITCIKKPFIYYRINTGSSQVDSLSRNPKSSYLAIYSVIERMREAGIYEEVKRGYVNIVVRLMRYYMDQMVSFENFCFLGEKFKNEIFPLIGAVDLPDGYFYDHRIEQWFNLINKYSAEEILMLSARGYGAQYTTAILRFQVPYDEIKKHSRIVLVGKGIIGRYWYAQLLISDYADVVCWVADENVIPEGIVYDQIVVAK